MNFATKIASSKSGRSALNAFNKMQLSPNGMPTANQLDNPKSQEEKVYKKAASTILRLADAEWWANAPRMQGSNKLLSVLKELADHGYNIEILSSPFGEASKQGKIQWCQDNLPEELTTFHIRNDKEALATPRSILIDDREKVCNKFQAAGGHTVVYNDLWMAELLSVIKNNTITTVYVDLDGVLVDTNSHLITTLKELT